MKSNTNVPPDFAVPDSSLVRDEIVGKWVPNSDPTLPNINSNFTFAALLAGTQTLVAIPGRKKLGHFIEAIRTIYGSSLTLPDPYGLNGIRTITGSQDVPPDTPNKILILWSSTRSANVCIYNLTIHQAIIACHRLTGSFPPMDVHVSLAHIEQTILESFLS